MNQNNIKIIQKTKQSIKHNKTYAKYIKMNILANEHEIKNIKNELQTQNHQNDKTTATRKKTLQ